MKNIRLTAAQAAIRYVANQRNEDGVSFISGCWAIFGHGNVAGLGEALHRERERFPTWRGHNEQTMSHIALAYAKQSRRRRAMMVTTSIGPGATNLVTAAATGYVNRLPILLMPGDVFAGRRPDPVLQQTEDFSDGTITANDCLRPVSRYFDRIERPEQLLTALPRAFRTMTDPAECGPATLAFCQDVQAEAFDWPETFFEPRTWRLRRTEPDPVELEAAAEAIRESRSPLIVAGGGVHYSLAAEALRDFVERHGIPVAETQAGKSALPWDHPLNLGPIGVTGAESANRRAENADLIFGIGTRFQDFTTGSWSLFKHPKRRILALNVQPYDASKHHALPLACDALAGMKKLSEALGSHRAEPLDPAEKASWFVKADAFTAPPEKDSNAIPTDSQIVGAVQRAARDDAIIACAAGTMPGELHKFWKAGSPLSYHMEYGFSCMGYEIAGGIGIKMADPKRDVIVMLGDGSYMMANSELATAAMMGIKLTLVITDNQGFGCINRLQMATGGEPFNNLLEDSVRENESRIDFAAHSASMGARSRKVADVAELEAALHEARDVPGPVAIVIDTDPYPSAAAGGAWWDVGIPEISERPEVLDARAEHERKRKAQRAD